MTKPSSTSCKRKGKVFHSKTKRCRRKCVDKVRSRRDSEHRCIIKRKQKYCLSLGKTYNPKSRTCRKKCKRNQIRRGTRQRCVLRK